MRINEAILAPICLVIDDEGKKIGELNTRDAIRLAEEKGLDLVEVSSGSNPPVCKFIDYGKLKYEETRAERKAKANQKTIDVKEIRFSFKISEHDIQLKISKAQKFLLQGNKVRLVIRMRGREQAFASRAFEQMQTIISQVGGTIEQTPNKLGNQISATISQSGSK